MSDIREWLEELGLDQYVEAFEQNEVDIDLVRDLGDEALEKLGVSVMGHRVKMLRAIAALPTRDSEIAPVIDVGEETSPAKKHAALDAERRQLTVMFCDLVGSTALSQKLDPETLRELMRSYQQCCGAVIDKYDGHVAQYLGDGLMVYFGWPRAHEDDAERAVRAGLEVVEAVKLVDGVSEPLQVRVGIATGPVVVGETGAGDASVPSAAVGETPNLAARMQGLAKPGEVIIAPTTYRLVSGVFEYEERGGQSVKGVAELVLTRRVVGEAVVEGRFEAVHGASLTPLVGRETEIAMLIERWRQAYDGEGQVVLLSGEPGIGKSRITQTLRERVAEEPHVRLRYQCSPYHTNSALHPVIEQIGRAAGFERDDDADAKLTKLEDLVGTDGTAPALFASMLSLEVGERYPPLAMSPQKQKEEMLQALIDQVSALSEQQPVLMIFEDAHWIDPTSQEMLDLLVPQIAAKNVLLVVTYRPEYEPPWSPGLDHLSTLSLNRLGRKQAAAMVEKVTGGKPLPGEVLDQIVAKTDGVPLFVEEVTKTVIESGIVKETGDAYELTGPLAELTIPSTIQDSLMARLDRLASVREFAQIGACIGREFSQELLAAVSPLGDNELDDALQQLVNNDLIFRSGSSYTFKHALVQDAAYASLLKSRRAQLHSALADVLIESFQGVAETAPETIAHHLTAAGRPEIAINYWERAGALASRRSSNVEAIAHLEKALSLVSSLPEEAIPAEQEMRLLNILAAPLMNTKGYAAPETGKVYERITLLCGTAGEGEQIFQALSGVSQYHMVVGDSISALQMAENMLERAEQAGQDDAILEAHRLIGLFAFSSGQFPRSVRHFDIVRELFDPARRAELALTYGQDHEMSSYIMQSIALAGLGYLDRARANVDAGIEASLKTDHAYSQAYALAVPLLTFDFMRDIDRIDAVAGEIVDFCSEHSIAYYLAFALVIQGYAMTRRGKLDQGIRQMQQGIEDYAKSGAGMVIPHFKTLLAEAVMARGDLSDAGTLLDEADEPWERWGEGLYRAETIRVRGDLIRQLGDDAAGEACYREAIVLAQRQKAKLWELRAATSLAGLWQTQGKSRKAHDLLKPVYDWFTEGFETPDLKEAKALLDAAP
jgi:class 3 adenylate cyclase/predicted ATPase